MGLHTDSVNQSLILCLLQTFNNQTILKHTAIVVIKQLHILCRILSGINKGIIVIIRSHSIIPKIILLANGILISVAYIKALIGNIHCIDKPRIIVLKIGENLLDVVFHTLQHNLTADKSTAILVILREKPLGGLTVPYQSMETNLHVMILRIFNG